MIASCPASQLDEIEAKLNDESHLVEFVGSDNAAAIPLREIIWLSSEDTSPSVEFDLAASGLRKLRLADAASAKNAAKQIGSGLGANYRHQARQRNEIVATAPAWTSFSIAWVLSFLYFKHAPWLVGLLGGLWMLTSLAVIALRLLKSPVIQSWRAPAYRMRHALRSAKQQRGWLLLLAVFFLGIFVVPQFVSNTPLHDYVADGGSDPKTINAIVSRGFDVDLDDGSGQTALDWALEFDNHQAAHVLIERGAAFQRPNPNGYSTIELAFGDPDDSPIAMLMLEQGLDANFKTPEGVGLLALALLSYQSPDLVKALLQQGADPRQLVEGEPAFEYVVRHEYSDDYLNPLLDAIAGR